MRSPVKETIASPVKVTGWGYQVPRRINRTYSKGKELLGEVLQTHIETKRFAGKENFEIPREKITLPQENVKGSTQDYPKKFNCVPRL